MAKGFDLARSTAPEHVAAIEAMKEQLLIVFVKRLGGKIVIPVAEIDDTGNDLFLFKVVGTDFHFEIQQKKR